MRRGEPGGDRRRRPIRAGFFIDGLEPGGGTENQLIFLLHRLDRKRVAPRLACLRARERSPRLPEDVVPAVLNIPEFRGTGLLSGLRRARAWIRRERLDVVLTFFRDANIVGTLGGRWAGIPVITFDSDAPGSKLHRLAKVFISNPKNGITVMDWQVSSSGYAAVWAEENTRASIWDAMQRRETYATTGPRMVVRFFGGWDYSAADANNRMPAAIGYAKGVPMGGDLEKAPNGKSPTFLVAALKDPIGANLDRIQIVKGWMNAKGELQEKVYDVAWGGDRKPGADGKLPPVGSTVDLANATWTNTIGAPELITVWKDPAFNAAERAFYYARVLEIPTPRWTAYDALRFGIKPLAGTRMTIQERAYTSPIWYTP